MVEANRKREFKSLYFGTPQEAAGPIPYDVGLPEAGLGWEKDGPLFERYSVKLVGRLDQRWAESYAGVVATSPGLVRFQLDADAALVSFTCSATDGPVEVMTVLKTLEGLLDRVNRAASLAAARFPTEPGADLAEAAASRSGAAGSDFSPPASLSE